jgi:hypothetical protein
MKATSTYNLKMFSVPPVPTSIPYPMLKCLFEINPHIYLNLTSLQPVLILFVLFLDVVPMIHIMHSSSSSKQGNGGSNFHGILAPKGIIKPGPDGRILQFHRKCINLMSFLN